MKWKQNEPHFHNSSKIQLQIYKIREKNRYTLHLHFVYTWPLTFLDWYRQLKVAGLNYYLDDGEGYSRNVSCAHI
jgi:hypothetical protein